MIRISHLRALLDGRLATTAMGTARRRRFLLGALALAAGRRRARFAGAATRPAGARAILDGAASMSQHQAARLGRYDPAMGSVDEVRALSAAWDEALVANNAEQVASFMIDDWVYVGPSGVTVKSDIIGWIASGRLRHDRMTLVGSDHVVHAGGAITLTARKASTGSWEGNPYTADEWITEVYVQTSNGWRCALSQKTPSPSCR